IILKSGRHVKELSQGFHLTTNNRMELMAVIVGLETIKVPGAHVTIHSDSRYVVDSVTKNWIYGWVRKGWKDVKNPDLWKRYLEISKKHHIRFIWVRGHNGHPENERCDVLAVNAATGRDLEHDSWYEENMSDNGLF
ncbi:MAG: ribonuclease, partial [Bacteroidota bacterium]